MTGVLRRGSIFVFVALTVLLATSNAGAHTEVQRATPGPGEVIEGDVDEVVLIFLDEIMPDPTVEVSGPDGVVPTDEPILDGRTLRVSMERSNEPGDYVVRYAFTAMDGDHQSEAYRFRITEPGSGLLAPGALVALIGLAGAVAAAATRRRPTVDVNSS